MNFYYETLIVIAISLIIVGFATLICFRDKHHFIRSAETEKNCYHLRKSRFLFLLVYGVTWNWKSGIILKSTFWGTLGFYFYYFCFYIVDMTYFIITNHYMIISQPIIFVIFGVVIPFMMAIIFSIIKAIINFKTHKNC